MGLRERPSELIEAGGSVLGASILVVDDQPANVLLLESLLARLGAGQVCSVTDPRRAVATFERIRPDLVLLDLHMPHMDGLDLMAQLRGATPDGEFVPVVVLTADATDLARQDALRAGANDFLTKPFDLNEVALRVRNLLETRSLHLALRRHNLDLQAELEASFEQQRLQAASYREKLERIEAVIRTRSIDIVFQPIVELATRKVIGMEALARFPEPHRTPDVWFAEAEEVGLGIELELLAIETALALAGRLPDAVYLSLNASPAAIMDPRLKAILAEVRRPIVLELTEHVVIEAYERILETMDELRARQVRLAIDDTGAGYSSLRHILQVGPDLMKLDIGLTRGIDSDPARRSLAAALVAFSQETGADIVAEGIETAAELEVLDRLGVPFGQGYFLGRPDRLADDH